MIKSRHIFLTLILLGTFVAARWIASAVIPLPTPAPAEIAQVTETPEPPMPSATATQVPVQTRYKFQSPVGYLLVEFLDDDLVHFELAPVGPGPSTDQPLFTSLMVYKTDYAGPQYVEDDGSGTLSTSDLIVQVDDKDLCVTVSDKTRQPALKLSTFCPYNFEKDFRGISFAPETFTQAYGLGEKFITAGVSDSDWVGGTRFPGDMGNQQESWNNGSVGNDQFPVLYLLGEGLDNYALFVDNPYKQYWDFSTSPWKAAMYGGAVRFYVMSGPDLPDLRQDFMELVGHAPLPPKQAFGLWVSEYGFDNWAELEDKLSTLRDNHFPVDGFVMDLQWYGGILENSDDTQEGSLTWNLQNFPDPQAEIARLRDEQGVGIVLIEQPYIGKNLPEHTQMESQGYLVKQCEDCPPVYLTANPWWGKGGMIDFSNPDATAYWHDTKREPLIADGILGHWTDLGEPELYDENGWYAGVLDGSSLVHGELDVHNLYNLLWSKSIYEGYQRNNHTQRPFILSRSGTVGSQRYGVAMWSGDISSLLSSLAAHLHVQVNMSLSGIDYYGSDIGGFWRQGGDENQIYTQWFADGMAFDVPGRVHTFNLCNCTETAPDRIGDLVSNLQNIRQRYELSPYTYSLAHRVYLFGEPLVPPVFYYYQQDPNVREMGSEKMLGSQLLVGAVAEEGKFETQVYLPAGTWIDYHTGDWVDSSGEWTGPINLYPQGVFTLPMFAKAGAIIPQMYVDDQTMNILGQRLDGTRRDELIVRVYADQNASQFTLYEDDGATTAYQQDEMLTTLIWQQQGQDSELVTIEASQGSYEGALSERDNFVQLYLDVVEASQVLLNGSILNEVTDETALNDAGSGWYNAGNGLVVIRTGTFPVDEAKEFEVKVVEPAAVSEAMPPSVEQLPAYWPTEGWQTATPEQQGMDSEAMAQVVDYLGKQKMDVHDLLVIRNGYVVTDANFYRLTHDAPFDRKSATDMVLGALVGIAIDQGYITSVQQPVVDFFPGREIANLNDKKSQVTLEDLLTNTSGFSCNDNNGVDSTGYIMMQSDDWVQFALDLPMSDVPGTVFNECSAATQIISGILQKTTGMSALDFARKNLFDPLGVGEVTWKTDPQGVNVAGLGLYLDLEDLARIAYLYLNEGNWNDEQVISAEWVKASLADHIPDVGFGYLWWLDPAGFFTWGHRGQALFVIPQLDLMVLMDGGITDNDQLTMEVLMRSLIIPAISEQPLLPENTTSMAKLQASIDAVGITPEPQPVPDLPETASQVSGKTYQVDTGEGGIIALTFEFPGGDEAFMRQETENDIIPLRLPIGLDGIYRVFYPDVDYFEVMMDDFPAMRGYWESENVFVIDYTYTYSTVSDSLLRLTFEGDQLTIEQSVNGQIFELTGNVKTD